LFDKIRRDRQLPKYLFQCSTVLEALNMSYKATSRTRKGQPVDLSHPFFQHTVPYDATTIAVDEASYVSVIRPDEAGQERADMHKHPQSVDAWYRYRLQSIVEGVVAHEITKETSINHSHVSSSVFQAQDRIVGQCLSTKLQ
jgi:hypothetical protein